MAIIVKPGDIMAAPRHGLIGMYPSKFLMSRVQKVYKRYAILRNGTKVDLQDGHTVGQKRLGPRWFVPTDEQVSEHLASKETRRRYTEARNWFECLLLTRHQMTLEQLEAMKSAYEGVQI